MLDICRNATSIGFGCPELGFKRFELVVNVWPAAVVRVFGLFTAIFHAVKHRHVLVLVRLQVFRRAVVHGRRDHGLGAA